MLTIRLRRMGAKHRPFYRVVVSDSRRTPRSSFVDAVGHYDPMQKPPTVSLDIARLEKWMAKGAQPSQRVLQLLKTELRRKAKAERTAAAQATETEAAGAEPSPAEGGGEESPGEGRPDQG